MNVAFVCIGLGGDPEVLLRLLAPGPGAYRPDPPRHAQEAPQGKDQTAFHTTFLLCISGFRYFFSTNLALRTRNLYGTGLPAWVRNRIRFRNLPLIYKYEQKSFKSFVGVRVIVTFLMAILSTFWIDPGTLVCTVGTNYSDPYSWILIRIQIQVFR